MKLPIDVVAERPLTFQWMQVVDTFAGRREVPHAGGLPSHVERAVADLVALAKQLDAARGKLQAFKDWVHQYLDAHGVPHAPPGTHGAAGCRIGDRMDWLMAKLAAAEAEAAKVTAPAPTAAPVPVRRGK